MSSALLVFGKATRPIASSACLTTSATCTTSGKPTSGDGSRSNSTKSGRSGLSTREYHAFMSMHPMLTIHVSASSSFTRGASIQRFSGGRVAAHREGPAVQVRHDHRRDRAVGVDQIALGDRRTRIVVGPKDLLEVGELHLPLRRLERPHAAHVLRRLVAAQSLERRRTEVTVV